MKSSMIMLAIIATFLVTWLFISFIGYMCTESIVFREAATHGGTLMFMLVFGWVPAVIVGADLNEKLA